MPEICNAVQTRLRRSSTRLGRRGQGRDDAEARPARTDHPRRAHPRRVPLPQDPRRAAQHGRGPGPGRPPVARHPPAPAARPRPPRGRSPRRRWPLYPARAADHNRSREDSPRGGSPTGPPPHIALHEATRCARGFRRASSWRSCCPSSLAPATADDPKADVDEGKKLLAEGDALADKGETTEAVIRYKRAFEQLLPGMRKIPFKHEVKRDVTAREDMKAMLIKEIDAEMTPAEFRANELGMKALGLLPARPRPQGDDGPRLLRGDRRLLRHQDRDHAPDQGARGQGQEAPELPRAAPGQDGRASTRTRTRRSSPTS